jgi:hypothetical protein
LTRFGPRRYISTTMTRSLAGVLLLASFVIAWVAVPVCGAGHCGMPCCKASSPSPVLAQEAGCCRVAAASRGTTFPALTVPTAKVPDAGRAVVVPADRWLDGTGALAARRPSRRDEASHGPGAVPLFILNTSLLI